MSRMMAVEDQIKKLQEEKSKVYSEERTAALSNIKGVIALFQFLPKELGFKIPKTASEKVEKERKAGSRNSTKKAAKKATRVRTH